MCSKCRVGKCVDEPTKHSPIEIDCPLCEGAGCDECKQCGDFEIDSCPLGYVPRHIWHAIQLADLYRRGLPPIIGGSLDQSSWFVDFCRTDWAEVARIKASMGATSTDDG